LKPLLTLDRLAKRFAGHAAVDDVSLTVREGEVLCLLGPSGCGKSTLLRLIAGFETPDAGTVRLGDADITGLPPHRRPVNMMVQSYALFPHLSVAGNLAYGLKGLGLSRAGVAGRVATLLRLVKLDGFEARRPATLSGGQRQRVALARALAREPRLLLLDEPLGALDRALREETQGELRAIQRRLGTGFVVVTHDPAEAMALSDRVGVMDRGRLVQVGPAAELYERPASRFVAGLLGEANLIEGRLGADGRVETAFGSIRPGTVRAGPGPVVIMVRPERLRLGPARGTEGEGALTGTVVEATYLGERIRRLVRMADGTVLRVSTPLPEGRDGGGPGETVGLAFPSEAACVLPA